MLADLLLTAAAEITPAAARGLQHPLADHRAAGAGGSSAAGLLPSRRGAGRRWRFGVLGQSARRLARDPARALLPATTLGLGIGAAVVMLVLVHDVLLQPLPLRQPERLVRMLEVDDEEGRAWWPSYLNFVDWREHADVFGGIAALDSPRAPPWLRFLRPLKCGRKDHKVSKTTEGPRWHRRRGPPWRGRRSCRAQHRANRANRSTRTCR